MRITASPEDDGLRLDLFLLRHAPATHTRAEIQRLITAGAVHIPGKQVVKPSTIVRAGHDIVLPSTFGTREPVPDSTRTPRAESRMPVLRILHEDPEFIVLDKPAGVPVHAGVKREPSLADALHARYPALRDVGADPTRAGIVHRLDKDTSGVLLVARTPEMYAYLQRQFQTRRVRKEYRALVHGVVPEDAGTIKLSITRSKRNPLRRTIARPGEGKEAETSFRVLERYLEHTLLAVFPKTGRMHQIRVHLAHLGFPVSGDPLYGRKSRHRTPPGLARQFLHAAKLSVALPTGKTRTFESALPTELALVLETLRARRTPSAEKPVMYRWRTPRAR